MERRIEVFEDLAARLRRAPRMPLRGEFARQSHPMARLHEPPPVVLHADRWQEVGDESVLYMCDGEDTAWAEWRRKVAASEGLEIGESVRNFGLIAVTVEEAIDMCDPMVQELLDVTVEELTGDELTTCRAVLAAARCVGVDALIAPSAARPGGRTILVLPHARKKVEVVFEERRAPPPI